MAKKDKNNELSCRLGTVGGEALIEGIMMKSRDRYSIAVRKENGTIDITNKEFKSVRSKYKILNLPIIRGPVNMVETMILSFKSLSHAVDAMDIVEEESKFEKWLSEKFGKSIMDFVMVIASILGFALGFGLFFFLPILITKWIDGLCGGNLGWFKNLIEGVIKIGVFIAYLALVSLMKDIRRTFEYHGAEHKTIFCYESGEELTPENVKKFKRFHPRCGTSFLFVILIISILIFSLPFVTWDNMILRLLTKVLLLPIVIGVGYEFIMFAGKHDNFITRALSAPGLLMQRITTREPDEQQIEIAIAALKNALPEVFPDEALPLTEDSPNGETSKEEMASSADASSKVETEAETESPEAEKESDAE